MTFEELERDYQQIKAEFRRLQKQHADIWPPRRRGEDATGVRVIRVKFRSGSSGSNAAQCDYVYDGYELDDTTLIAESLELVDNGVRTAVGAYELATYGELFVDGDGVAKLYSVNEAPVAVACVPPE